MRIKARAKINWTLDITGQREDGYHLMDMLMQPLELSDILTLEPDNHLSLYVQGAELSGGEDNLVQKAARMLSAVSGHPANAKIRLQKNIPMGAGLGGGSADAAAVLKALNQMWELHYTPEKLCEIGLRIGADVPFCVMDQPMRAQGIGEVLTPIQIGRCFPLLLLQPCEALSTGEIFRGYHAASPLHPDTEKSRLALQKGDLAGLKAFGGNVLETVSVRKRPAIARAKEQLYDCGAAFAQMTGSGSVVIGAFEDSEIALAARERLKGTMPVCILTQTAL